ncbi:sigma-54-dependent transcriptional regulator [Paraglaciecola arctica]|uniref:sigma-54-dependent transcriptional regulator n=1 Tax=Paraglaciecola arctica TaxID=1128911 RepID=UPI001C06E7E1|nr:sigma-54 dependent transcriptional regulator [Paraglaciecola arctica]MBU3005479.1 sigma-54 dependent transcriptional regulator [Paraglaciecola arctica]
MKANILIIDDNQDIVQALQVLFTINNMQCGLAYSPQDGLAMLQQHHFDLIIQDMNFTADTTSGEEGMQLFNDIRQINPDIPIILITAWTHLETAVELVKSGAADYLAKPWNDDKLLITVNNLLELNELQDQQRQSAKRKQNQQIQLEQQYNLCGMQFRSDAMLQLLQMATQVAAADVPILITGPNGSGKEKIAEVVQANSSCKNGPFIKVNVGALSQDLLEAELFGAEAGSYTGANKTRIGRFERANGGTLFLDEIGNLSIQGQAKLLRVLETGEFERIGGSQSIKVSVRIISATNTDIPKAIQNGSFREDLYYRLNVINLKLAPLNERKEDIFPLVDTLLQGDYQLSSASREMLLIHDWPGNIRELLNTIKRAQLLCVDGIITEQHLGIELIKTNKLSPKEDVTEQDVVTAIRSSSGVISDAAKSLGLSRSAFYRRMKKFDIKDV